MGNIKLYIITSLALLLACSNKFETEIIEYHWKGEYLEMEIPSTNVVRNERSMEVAHSSYNYQDTSQIVIYCGTNYKFTEFESEHYSLVKEFNVDDRTIREGINKNNGKYWKEIKFHTGGPLIIYRHVSEENKEIFDRAFNSIKFVEGNE